MGGARDPISGSHEPEEQLPSARLMRLGRATMFQCLRDVLGDLARLQGFFQHGTSHVLRTAFAKYPFRVSSAAGLITAPRCHTRERSGAWWKVPGPAPTGKAGYAMKPLTRPASGLRVPAPGRHSGGWCRRLPLRHTGLDRCRRSAYLGRCRPTARRGPGRPRAGLGPGRRRADRGRHRRRAHRCRLGRGSRRCPPARR